ncbi:MAG: Bax inhibitor-1/YccA family protein [Chitinophagales bacterium]|nr:Bax inhibitor-1/YccA family protein [Chitinophagales bacterium]
MNQTIHITSLEQQVAQANFISKVYAWMSAALVITGLTAYYVAGQPSIVETIFSNKIYYYGLFFATLGIVFVFNAMINKMSVALAGGIFITYSVLMGIMLSSIFLIYTSSSIASCFFITAGTFMGMSAFGYYTKRDLTAMGNLLYMALLGIIIASVVNMFIHSTMLYWITTYIGVIIFVGLIAYDTQKIKDMNDSVPAGSDAQKKLAMIGAMSLYLDFINLFLYILRIFGGRKD